MSRLCHVAAAALLLSLSGVSPAAEPEPTVAAAELVEPALLAGPNFRVQPHARMEGLHARFVIETAWGPLDAPSIELLARRVAEMPLVEALHSESIMDALAEAGVGSLREPVKQLERLARDPLGAAVRAPAGVFRMFATRLRGYGDRARRIGNRIDRAVFHDGSPAGSDSTAGPPVEEPWWDAPVDEIGGLLRSEAGHSRARRDIAGALGIESWTGNPLMRDRLDALAWALASGRLASERVIGLLSAGAANTIAAAATVERITAQPSPDDQRRQLEARLERLSADPDLRYRLAWRSAFPPAQLERLLDRADALQATSGQEALLDTALLARSELEVLFVLNALELLLHNGDVPVAGGQLIPVGHLVGYLASDGEFMLPLAVDRVSWTPEVKAWFDHAKVSEHGRRTVLVAGSLSMTAERAITRRGWSIRSNVRWPGSPPYRQPGDAA